MSNLSQSSIDEIKKEAALELLDMTPDFAYIKDKEHRILYANDSYVKLTKYENLEEIIGKTVFDLFPKEHAQNYFEYEKEVIASKNSINDIEQIYINRRNEISYAKTTLKPMYDEQNNIVGLLGISKDVSQMKIHKAMLKEYSDYDASTGLYNKKMFLEQSKKLLEYCKRECEESIVLCIRLNNFKDLSEKFDEKVVDRLLKVVSQRLKKAFRTSDLICKSNIDEFIIFSISNDDKKILDPLKEHIMESISKEIEFDENRINIDCSIGFASFPNDARDIEKLIFIADQNMYTKQS